MSKNTLLSELINYISANASGNVVIAAPSSGYALDVTGTGRFTGQLTGTTASFSSVSTNPIVTLKNSDGDTEASFAIAQGVGLYLNVYNTISTRALDFKIGGSSAVIVTNNRNVLIGTTSDAGYKLDIAGTGRFTGALTGTSATFSTTIADYAMSVSNVLDSSQGLLVRATDNDGDLYLLRLQSSNGATSQTWVDRFTVAKSGAATFSSSVTATAPSSGVALQVNGRSSDNIGQILFYANNGTTLQNYIQSRPTYLAINTETNTPMYFGTYVGGTGGTRMTINESGNVGIGTTSPGGLLALAGVGGYLIEMNVNANTPRIDIIDGNVYTAQLKSNGGLVTLANSSNNPIAFNTNGSERMRITPGGNLGLGVTNPSAKLHVSGGVAMGTSDSSTALNVRMVKQGATSITFTATVNVIGAWRPGHATIRVTGTQNGLQEYWSAYYDIRVIAYFGSGAGVDVINSGGATGSVSFSSTATGSSTNPQVITFTLTDSGGTTNNMIADIDFTYNEGIISIT